MAREHYRRGLERLRRSHRTCYAEMRSLASVRETARRTRSGGLRAQESIPSRLRRAERLRLGKSLHLARPSRESFQEWRRVETRAPKCWLQLPRLESRD